MASLGDQINGDQPTDILSEMVEVHISREELAAIDGWRQAHELDTREAALRQLVRLGLLSEIGRIFTGPQNEANE